jgi:superfamily I DNA/RNA helicase
MLGEILHCGPKTQKVWQRYSQLLEMFGTEMSILQDASESDLYAYWPELGEAVHRMRGGKVIRRAGYDGQYGVIHLFEEGENTPTLLDRVPAARRRPLKKQADTAAPAPNPPQQCRQAFRYTAAQATAIAHRGGPVLVLAGPGTGKTRTLVGRILRLLEEGVSPDDMAAVTFTRRAAEEMHDRLAALLPKERIPRVDTLHALALERWQGEKPVILSAEGALRAFLAANQAMEKKDAAQAFSALELAREQMVIPPELQEPLSRYRNWKQKRGLADYTDLPEAWLAELRGRNYGVPSPWRHLLVDEVQDLSPLQKALVQDLVPADGSGFFGIGDPDQSIYGFRGADGGIEESLRSRWPSLTVLTLDESHRSAEAVLRAGQQTLRGTSSSGSLHSVTGTAATLQWLRAPTAEREAAWIAGRIAWLLGGTSHQEADQHVSITGCHMESGSCSPGDIAVLCRLKALIPPIKAALERRGIPCAAPENEAFWNEERTERMLSAAALFQHRLVHAQREAALRDAARFPLLAVTAPSIDPVPALEEPWASIPEKTWGMGPQAVLERAAGAFDPLYADSTAFRQLCTAWKEHGGWEGLLEHVAFRRELDAVRGRSEHVQIMTMHASKGLEFRAVFIPACEDGILPFRGVASLLAPPDPQAACPEEEIRLMYVGITRAAEAVFLSSAVRRTLFGHALELAPSPLIPQGCFHPVKLTRHAKTTASQLNLC